MGPAIFWLTMVMVAGFFFVRGMSNAGQAGDAVRSGLPFGSAQIQSLETAVQHQVVQDLQSAGEKERGSGRAGRARNWPASTGERAAPVVRAMPVTPAAAERSSGATTCMV